jgi:DNA-binding transcriptional MerR regulator
MDESWTIVELAELAAEALTRSGALGPDTTAATGGAEGELGEGPGAGLPRVNGRVRDVPNERLIRWYGTVGLVDPPLSRRGRVARYGRRHLLQLVAVKRRQAAGTSLAEIQAELAGLTDEALAAIAGLPAPGPAPATQASALPAVGATAPVAAGLGRFWARQPQQAADDAPATSTDQDRRDGPPGGLVYGLKLAPGATLLLEDANREPGPEDMTAIASAAGPLLRELASRGLGAFGPLASQPDNPQTEAGHEHRHRTD